MDLLLGVPSTTFSPCLRGVDCCTEGDPVDTSEVLSAKAVEVELDLGFAAATVQVLFFLGPGEASLDLDTLSTAAALWRCWVPLEFGMLFPWCGRDFAGNMEGFVRCVALMGLNFLLPLSLVADGLGINLVVLAALVPAVPLPAKGNLSLRLD